MRRRKEKKILKTETLEILLDPEFKAALRNAAAMKRKSVSQYVRDLLLDDLERRGSLRPEERRP